MSLYHQADCGEPSVAIGVEVISLLSTIEGSEIMYQCGSGFHPQAMVITAVCGNNGLWSPDPTLQNCTG